MSRKRALSSANEIQPARKKVIPSLFDDDSLDDDTGNDTDPLEPGADQPEAKDESERQYTRMAMFPQRLRQKQLCWMCSYEYKLYLRFFCAL